MLKHRIISGVILGTALLAAVVFAQPVVALAIIGLLCVLALIEFYDILDAADIPNFRHVCVGAGLLMLFVEWGALLHPESSRLRADSDALAVVAAFGLLFVRQFFARDNDRPLHTLAGSLLGLGYICVPLLFFLKIAMLGGGVGGRWLLLYMIVVVKFTDIGAFFVGSAIGRHKLIPRISPHKSWEGVAGGMGFALIGSLLMRQATQGQLGPVVLSVPHALGLGGLLAVTGILGDLAESLVKRSAGVKDSGRMIAGMGGLLDVIDSLLPAAPVMYLYVRHLM